MFRFWKRQHSEISRSKAVKCFLVAPRDSFCLAIKVSRSINTSNVAPSEVKKKQTIIESDGTNITSPIVGTAYLAPEPGGKKFVEIGQKIKKGQTIMIVEAMKTMNHVPSTHDGTVSKIFVKDGEPVEFGQPLVSLK